jgi:hypothetical protein
MDFHGLLQGYLYFLLHFLLPLQAFGIRDIILKISPCEAIYNSNYGLNYSCHFSLDTAANETN